MDAVVLTLYYGLGRDTLLDIRDSLESSTKSTGTSRTYPRDRIIALTDSLLSQKYLFNASSTFEEVGEELHCSRENIHQRIERVLKKLRQISNQKNRLETRYKL